MYWQETALMYNLKIYNLRLNETKSPYVNNSIVNL